MLKIFFYFIKITWFKDSVVLPAANRYTTNYDLSSNIASLKIHNAQMNDLGSYMALAENEVGKDKTSCAVFVQEMPNIDQTPMVNPEAFRFLDQPVIRKKPDADFEEKAEPPQVIVPLQDLQLKEGENVLLVAKIIGRPTPKVNKKSKYSYFIHFIIYLDYFLHANTLCVCVTKHYLKHKIYIHKLLFFSNLISI